MFATYLRFHFSLKKKEIEFSKMSYVDLIQSPSTKYTVLKWLRKHPDVKFYVKSAKNIGAIFFLNDLLLIL